MSDRTWFIALGSEIEGPALGSLIGLLGPIKDGEEAAIALQTKMLEVDQAMADALDWEHPDVCAPDLYRSLQVVTLSAEEIAHFTDALAAAAKEQIDG